MQDPVLQGNTSIPGVRKSVLRSVGYAAACEVSTHWAYFSTWVTANVFSHNPRRPQNFQDISLPWKSWREEWASEKNLMTYSLVWYMRSPVPSLDVV